MTKERRKILLDENSKEDPLSYIPSNVTHAVKNIGEINASIIMFSKTAEISSDTTGNEMEV